jgi:vancomycin resistance protein VanJ
VRVTAGGDNRAGAQMPPRRARRWPLVVSLLLWAALSLCGVTRPDALAALNMIPAWFWPLPGIALAALACRAGIRRGAGMLVLLWIVFLFCFADEPRGLVTFRSWPASGWSAAVREGTGLRVVTLNCAGGSVEAAEEAVKLKPDILLLQESPGSSDVEQLARKMYGRNAGWVCGPDTAILARGKVRPELLPTYVRGFVVAARVRLTTGHEVEVICLRLDPLVLGEGLWRGSLKTREAHRAQMRAVCRLLRTIPRRVPVIVGGDFNAPARDGALACLRPRFGDAFESAGVGWGDTVLNDFPVHRFDQVWVSRQLRPLAVVALKTRHSDHRMVVCDMLAGK